jgi:D-alanyl-D-alanine carboxypeptidase/D-alanyl-D-alanine-endopeptidase (penicillin-binding protein 4)
MALILPMMRSVSRRAVLGGLLAGAAVVPAMASAPLTSVRPLPRGMLPPPPAPPSVETLVEAARLGGQVTFAVADMSDGALVESREPLLAQPPASVAKALTALYALDLLGPGYRFPTQVIATGPIVNGRVDGDIVLAGGGDPTLDTDRLGDLVAAMKAAGVREATGRFRTWGGVLPAIAEIDDDQPPQVGYNPAISGLNLNYNRVHFEWKRGADGYAISMEARGERFSPRVTIARMSIATEQGPVYTYSEAEGVDRWSVARRALGDDGSRWLPVRRPEAYAGEVFLSLARSFGIELRPGDPLGSPPQGTVVAELQSDELRVMMRDMLRWSTNLTAEVAGLTASTVIGPQPYSLAGSAARMNTWAAARFGASRPALIDHSGLGYGSGITAADMVRLLTASERDMGLSAILRDFPVTAADRDRSPVAGVSVAAKTGTLNFVSALAGYARTGTGRDMAFAIFTADTARRDSVPIEEREQARGAREWARRSRRLQQDLILRWANVHGA